MGTLVRYTDRKGGEAVEYSDHELVHGIKGRDFLIVAALTQRTALSLVLCGGSCLLFFAYSAVGFHLPDFLRVTLGALYRFGFCGYLLQESYSWTTVGCPGS